MLSFLSSLYRPLCLQHPAGTGQKVDDTNSPTSGKMLTVVNKFETNDHGEMVETFRTKMIELDGVTKLRIVDHGGMVKRFETDKPGPDKVDNFETDYNGDNVRELKTGKAGLNCVNELNTNDHGEIVSNVNIIIKIQPNEGDNVGSGTAGGVTKLFFFFLWAQHHVVMIQQYHLEV